MLNSNIDTILYITGGITFSMILQFLAPQFFLKAFCKIDTDDEIALFFARCVGMPIALNGVLLIWAGIDPSIRFPILVTAIIGKATFVLLLIRNFKTFTKGYLGTIIFDTFCVLIYSAYLIGLS